MEAKPEKHMSETILYKDSPAMFRNRPILFIICCLLIPVFGLGLIPLGIWWLQCWGTALTVTDERVALRRGILSKYTNDVLIADIRNVQVAQNLFQRMFGVGAVGVSSAGQGGMEIEVHGIPKPQAVKAIIDDQRKKQRRG
jgi:uncharacterized membrane protein YdbT with pleckstrin-like domain